MPKAHAVWRLGQMGGFMAVAMKGIVSYAPDGKKSVRLRGVNCQDIAVTREGGLYFTESLSGRVGYLPPGNSNHWVAVIANVGPRASLNANGVCLSPDQSMLYVSDPDGKVGVVVPSAIGRLPR